MISKSTQQLIDGIDSLFSADERAALEYTRGDLKFTIKMQLLAKYGHQYVIYENYNEALVKAANIIEAKSILILQLAKLKDLYGDLLDPDSYNKKRSLVIDNTSTGKTIGLTTSQAARETLRASKTRGGEALRSIDYIDQEQQWNKEDNEALMSNIQLSFKKVRNENIDTAKVEYAYSDKINNPSPIVTIDTAKETKGTTDEQTRPVINSIGIESGRNKAIAKAIDNVDSFSEKKSHQDKTETTTTTNRAINIINILHLEIPDIREKFFRLFSCLFSKYPVVCQ